MRQFFHDTLLITKRNLIRLRRTPQLLIFSSIQPVIFLLLFNYVFGGAVTNGGALGDRYIMFLLPGILAQTAVFGSLQTGVGMAEDMSRGVIDRFLSLPIHRGAVVAGRTIADAARNIFVVCLMIGVGMLLGFRFDQGWGDGVAAIGLAVLFGFAFSWISLTIGLLVKDSESAQAASFIWAFPLVFASSVFVPTTTMPDWLRAFAEHQPITQVVNAVRYLTTGLGSGDAVWYTIYWVAGIILVFSFLATRLFRRAL